MSKLFCLPSEKGSIQKGKNLFSIGGKFFPFSPIKPPSDYFG